MATRPTARSGPTEIPALPIIAVLGLAAVGIHLYRWYRWIAYGEPLP